MPTYDYHCAANGRTLEVKHRMSEEVRTWGELCALAGVSLDATPADTPVAKQLAASMIASGASLGCDAGPPVMGGMGGCGMGGCGHAH
ncbi:MAG: zinc ribbon domain-containing protein [Acidobacteria bacterium]|nr:zinc ribbon domain-containing protein [Acidobacteriota bacterium]